MTIDKDRCVKIPIWLVSIVLPIVITLITSYMVITNKTAKLEADNEYNKHQIEILHQSKANQETIQLVLTKLNDIDKKLEDHISNCK